MEADDGEIVNMSNSQTLANLLVVFCEDYDEKYARSEELQTYFSRGEDVENLRYSTRETLERNRYTAVGVAAGYLNLTANLLGYRQVAVSVTMQMELIAYSTVTKPYC